jgi:hypothetical protein
MYFPSVKISAWGKYKIVAVQEKMEVPYKHDRSEPN